MVGFQQLWRRRCNAVGDGDGHFSAPLYEKKNAARFDREKVRSINVNIMFPNKIYPLVLLLTPYDIVSGQVI